MSEKVSITLDEKVSEFADRMSDDRSNYTNNGLLAEQKMIFIQELANAYKEQSNDPDMPQEIAVWNITLGDGVL